MKRDELLNSCEWWLAEIQNDLFGIINEFMIKNKLNRSGLAKKFNVTKGYITQVLNGDFDHKISKLVDLAIACGKAPIISYVDLDQYIKDDAKGVRCVCQTNTRPIKETPILTGKDACNFVNEINKSSKGSFSQSELERIKANFEKIKALVQK